MNSICWRWTKLLIMRCSIPWTASNYGKSKTTNVIVGGKGLSPSMDHAATENRWGTDHQCKLIFDLCPFIEYVAVFDAALNTTMIIETRVWQGESISTLHIFLFQIESASLPKATFARLKPQNIEFLQVTNMRAMLEVREMRSKITLRRISEKYGKFVHGRFVLQRWNKNGKRFHQMIEKRYVRESKILDQWMKYRHCRWSCVSSRVSQRRIESPWDTTTRHSNSSLWSSNRVWSFPLIVVIAWIRDTLENNPRPLMM